MIVEGHDTLTDQVFNLSVGLSQQPFYRNRRFEAAVLQ